MDWETFAKVDMRVGTIINVEPFPEARNPAYKLTIDFGKELGVKKSSAQITSLYTIENLMGKQIVAVVNFPPKQVANIKSECLVLGVLGNDKDVILLQPESSAENGWKIS